MLNRRTWLGLRIAPPEPIAFRTEEHQHDRDCVSLPPAPGIRDGYVALADRMNELARTMPGYISHKGFFADDGERVTVVEFEHEEGMRAWRTNPEHQAAQKLAREKYYSEYHIQVCTVDRQSSFKAVEEPAAAQG